MLKNPACRFKRIGLEAGPLSQWLFSALAEVGLPVICVETRHMRAALKAQINKTDRNDARGMAQMMRVGLYRPVHVKTLRSQKLRMLLTHRKLLQLDPTGLLEKATWRIDLGHVRYVTRDSAVDRHGSVSVDRHRDPETLERPLASVLVVSGTGNVSLLQPGACPLGSYFRSVVVRIVCSHCCSMPESKITLRHLMISRFNRSESSSGLVGSGSRPSSV